MAASDACVRAFFGAGLTRCIGSSRPALAGIDTREEPEKP
jgi:hypothetical protein